jgi:hypothetical protein
MSDWRNALLSRRGASDQAQHWLVSPRSRSMGESAARSLGCRCSSEAVLSASESESEVSQNLSYPVVIEDETLIIIARFPGIRSVKRRGQPRFPDRAVVVPGLVSFFTRNLSWSEALIIFGIHEYNRCIHENLYVSMKFKGFTDTLGVLWNYFNSDFSGRNSASYAICFRMSKLKQSLAFTNRSPLLVY